MGGCWGLGSRNICSKNEDECSRKKECVEQYLRKGGGGGGVLVIRNEFLRKLGEGILGYEK